MQRGCSASQGGEGPPSPTSPLRRQQRSPTSPLRRPHERDTIVKKKVLGATNCTNWLFKHLWHTNVKIPSTAIFDEKHIFTDWFFYSKNSKYNSGNGTILRHRDEHMSLLLLHSDFDAGHPTVTGDRSRKKGKLKAQLDPSALIVSERCKDDRCRLLERRQLDHVFASLRSRINREEKTISSFVRTEDERPVEEGEGFKSDVPRKAKLERKVARHASDATLEPWLPVILQEHILPEDDIGYVVSFSCHRVPQELAIEDAPEDSQVDKAGDGMSNVGHGSLSQVYASWTQLIVTEDEFGIGGIVRVGSFSYTNCYKYQRQNPINDAKPVRIPIAVLLRQAMMGLVNELTMANNFSISEIVCEFVLEDSSRGQGPTCQRSNHSSMGKPFNEKLRRMTLTGCHWVEYGVLERLLMEKKRQRAAYKRIFAGDDSAFEKDEPCNTHSFAKAERDMCSDFMLTTDAKLNRGQTQPVLLGQRRLRPQSAGCRRVDGMSQRHVSHEVRAALRESQQQLRMVLDKLQATEISKLELEGEVQVARRRNEEQQLALDQMTAAMHIEKANGLQAVRQLETELRKQKEFRDTVETRLKERERDLELAHLKNRQDDVDIATWKTECQRLRKELQQFMDNDPRAVSLYQKQERTERELQSAHREMEALRKHIRLLEDSMAFNDKKLDYLGEFMGRTRLLLADVDAPGVNPPKRVAGGFGKFPRPSQENVMKVVMALTNGKYNNMRCPGNLYIHLPQAKVVYEPKKRKKKASSGKGSPSPSKSNTLPSSVPGTTRAPQSSKKPNDHYAVINEHEKDKKKRAAVAAKTS